MVSMQKMQTKFSIILVTTCIVEWLRPNRNGLDESACDSRFLMNTGFIFGANTEITEITDISMLTNYISNKVFTFRVKTSGVA